ncbi:MAG: hypothetical protein Q8W45_11950 [Candidatus Palauibacterales bacterium]|nr:hypothetical protein [Candidatus Palauibacterales bacterium]
MRSLVLALLSVGLVACRQRTPTTDDEVRRLAADVIPKIERTVGLEFRTPPRLAVRDRAAVERYLIGRLDDEYPTERMEDISTAYRLFGLIPDTLDLRATLLAVLAEQVVGYYDPDSLTLYVVEGTDPVQIRLVLAHELVHALQGQYVPLDSLLTLRNENDRQMAAQAVLEGQATLASLTAMLDEERLRQLGTFWGDVRASVRNQQESMPLFAKAPLVIREGLLFPYLAGADFVRWFQQQYPDTLPFGPRMPLSTEQILYTDRYAEGDEPVTLRFRPAPYAGDLVYEDTWGQFETRLILRELTGSESLGNAGALGWEGDRFAVFRAGADDAIVWWSVWGSPQMASKFAAMLERSWGRDGRRWAVRQESVGSLPAVVLVDGPATWAGWDRLPGVQILE